MYKGTNPTVFLQTKAITPYICRWNKYAHILEYDKIVKNLFVFSLPILSKYDDSINITPTREKEATTCMTSPPYFKSAYTEPTNIKRHPNCIIADLVHSKGKGDF